MRKFSGTPNSHAAVLHGVAGGYSHLHNISITYEKVSGNSLEYKASILNNSVIFQKNLFKY